MTIFWRGNILQARGTKWSELGIGDINTRAKNQVYLTELKWEWGESNTRHSTLSFEIIPWFLLNGFSFTLSFGDKHVLSH